MPQNDDPLRLLLIEDDEVDVLAIRRALVKLDARCELLVADDGLTALEMMRGTKSQARIQGPYVVLLDWKLPRMHGGEFLRELRADPRLRSTIVFVMSTSDAAEDRRLAYEYNAAGYMVKEGSKDAYTTAIDTLLKYCALIELPVHDHKRTSRRAG
ncbi:MAG: response regulator [Pseudomonadota bacterium]